MPLPFSMNTAISPRNLKDFSGVTLCNVRPNRLQRALERRCGFSKLFTNNLSSRVIAMTYYELASGNGYLAAHTLDGKVTMLKVRDSSAGRCWTAGWGTPVTGFGSAPGSFAPQRLDYLYFSTSTKQLGWSDGTTTFTLGLDRFNGSLTTDNSDSSASNIQTGNYIYFITKWHEGRRVESLPQKGQRSATVDAPAVGSSVVFQFQPLSPLVIGKLNFDAMTLTNYDLTASASPPSLTPATSARIYRAFISDIMNRNIFTIYKARLVGETAQLTTPMYDASAEAELGELCTFGGTTAPLWAISALFKSYWLYAGVSAHPERVYISLPDSPENVPMDVTLTLEGSLVAKKIRPQPMEGFYAEQWMAFNAPVTAIAPLNAGFVVGTTRGTFFVAGSNIANFHRTLICDEDCLHPETMVSTPYGVVWLSSSGLMLFNGESVRNITKHVLDLDGSPFSVSRADMADCRAAFISSENSYVISLPNASGSFKKLLWCNFSGGEELDFYYDDLTNSLTLLEEITSLCCMNLRGYNDFLLLGTSSGNFLAEKTPSLGTASYNDNNGTTNTAVSPAIAFYVGQESFHEMKSGGAVRVNTTGNTSHTLQLSVVPVRSQNLDETADNLTLTPDANNVATGRFRGQGYLYYMALTEPTPTATALTITDIDVEFIDHQGKGLQRDNRA